MVSKRGGGVRRELDSCDESFMDVLVAVLMVVLMVVLVAILMAVLMAITAQHHTLLPVHAWLIAAPCVWMMP